MSLDPPPTRRSPFRMSLRSLMLATLCLAVLFHYLVQSRRRTLDAQIRYCLRFEAGAARAKVRPTRFQPDIPTAATYAAQRAHLTALRRSWWPWSWNPRLLHGPGCECKDCPNDPTIRAVWARLRRRLPPWANILIREADPRLIANRTLMATAAVAALVAVLRRRRGRARGPVAEVHAGSTHRGP